MTEKAVGIPPLQSFAITTSYTEETRRLCALAAQRLLASFQHAAAHDPESFLAGVIAVLTRYPLDVVAEVTNPATGLPSKMKFLPSISEVREACEAANGVKRDKEIRERNLREQLAEREERERLGVQTLNPPGDPPIVTRPQANYWRSPPNMVGRFKKLEGKIVEGGKTVYTSTGFHDAVEAHGSPIGPFEQGRQLPYDAS